MIRKPPGGGPRDDLDAQDGIAAELEEVVVDADRLDPQDARPDLGEVTFDRVAGGAVSVAPSSGRRRAAWSSLPLAAAGSDSSGTIAVGTMNGGSRGSGTRRSSSWSGTAPAGTIPGGELLAPAFLVEYQGDGLRHRRMGGELGFDLAELDAEAA